VRILICASDAPLLPVNTGYRRQLMGLVPELAKRHDVRLIGYQHPDQSDTSAVEADMRIIRYEKPGRLANVHDLALATALRRPARAARLQAGLRDALREEIDRFRPDVVHVGPGKLSGLLKDLRGLPNVLGVMDAWFLNVDARAEVAGSELKAALFRKDSKRIQRFMSTQYRGWDRIVPSNVDDMETMLDLDPTLPMALIPIGFDASAYAPDPQAQVDKTRIMFHGALNYAPNMSCVEHLARDILPLVRAQRPDAHLVIVGRNPAPSVLALGELPGVEVLGEVEDMRAELNRSRVWAGPFLSGTGIKTKLLEAMATDLAAVVTPTGGRGLDLENGKLLVGNDAQEMAMHLLAVLNDDGLAARLATEGGAYVRANYDWAAVGRSFEMLYEQVIDETLLRAA
jgi:glycosyltransferase involved in cell wall biosynthesis